MADGREGTLTTPVDTRAEYAPLWRNLDRNVPLGVKLTVPILLVTLLGTLVFGYTIAEQTRRATEADYIADANATAHGAAVDFSRNQGRQQDLASDLNSLIADEPNLLGVWIVDLSQPGVPVVASSDATAIGSTGRLDSSEIASIQHAGTTHSDETKNGRPVLETIQAIPGGPYAVVILSSLEGESLAIAQTVLWIALAGVIVGLLEVSGLWLILEFGVLRRIRRVQRAIASYGRDRTHVVLSEGDEPSGRDVLFNLARDVDHKLAELNERQRGGDLISDLGIASLQGAAPEELSAKALELVHRTAGLDKCFLVDTSGAEVVVTAFGEGLDHSAGAELPIWLGALVRAAARARRPVLADKLGEACRFWDAHTESRQAEAAFVPLAGTPDPIGVMVALAKPGSLLNSAIVNLMEAVATTLGETLQRNAAVKARNESDVKSRALSTVSHEMRNPLNAMVGFTGLLLSGSAGPINTKQHDYLKRVDDASHHLLSLVNDYLELARIMAGSLPLMIEDVQVEGEVKGVIDLIGQAAAEKHVLVRADVSPTAVARVDRLRLRQVLINLLSNAIKFTPANGHVRIEAAGNTNGVRISVIDTGIGIPADRQHLIFTEFAQLHQGDSANGSGLGLVVTKRLVDAMGGFIRFTSSEGAGTIFDVWLPGEYSPVASAAEAASV